MLNINIAGLGNLLDLIQLTMTAKSKISEEKAVLIGKETGLWISCGYKNKL